MGSGKTTVGRALAKQLKKRFIDSDHEIEARTGVSVSAIFEIEGEASFRQREAEIIRELSALDNIVLATGGGAILNPESRRYLHERGTVIYLRASIGSILHRTRHDKSRPLLRTADPRKKLEELESLRDPLYRETAHFTIDTGRPNIQFLMQSILAQLDQINYSVPNAANSMKSSNNNVATVESASEYTVMQVQLPERSYPIIIGDRLLEDGDMLARHIVGKQLVIVTNSVVAPLYLDGLVEQLRKLGKQVDAIVLPDGEETKNWHSLMQIFDELLRLQCDRKMTLIALGGGVIGDMTGFAAATYMRGVKFIQIPTTLLAQVDSSVGGKTGINHPLGKNMIGAFYQPQCVLADTSTLNTLPDRELSAGLAEVIKHGAIIDPKFFDWIETTMPLLRSKDAKALTYAIKRSCEIKAEVVRQDERESGIRAILNFGHTFGHAIESGLGFGKWLHGEAVGCGMVMAAELSLRMGHIDYVSKVRLTKLVEAAGLPILPPDFSVKEWVQWMSVDKKNEGGKIKFILLKPLGKSLITEVPDELLEATLLACKGH